MYPITLGYDEAVVRIELLLKNGHYAEALVTSMFTVEKTLRRTLRQIVVSAGFTSKQADKIINNLRGLAAIKSNWELYEPNNMKLTELLPAENWKRLQDVSVMRNKMVHGERTYNLEVCERETIEVLKVLDQLKKDFDELYGYSGWTPYAKRRKSQLHKDPKVKQ